ncbi:glycosyltransferase family 2 protein [Arthrobacter sp. SO3]|uniref:glycosyltransferase family 2 protein n=1 Tax=Arthrobacter sp. SO3 TaxID=1897057 RepID=UPI001CFFD007|nr:hypothetical protein [Arthrobacter sp. SO3]MCB5291209.1 N-acetylglucosaminyl-diphospho-decaprenol L-rhamnosyltransferase [Arthrobacter sp. SO3]
MTLHFILACHNRRKSTLSCLRSLAISCRAAKVSYDVTLFDDGSSDGTSASVLSEFPNTTVCYGNGSNFWAKSMAGAESNVLSKLKEDFDSDDFIVWINDDITLDEDSIGRILSVSNEFNSRSILVGAMRDPDSGVTTYSGLNRRGLHPLSFRIQEPSSVVQEVEAFNGNLVMVPVSSAKILQGIDDGYSHALADIDYGLRATAHGIKNLLAPGTYGVCSRNISPPLGIREEWRRFIGPKGAGNVSSMKKILELISPKSWPFYFLLSYSTWIARYSLRTVIFAVKNLKK